MNFGEAMILQDGTLSTQDSVIHLEETIEETIWRSVSVLRIPEREKLAQRLLEIQNEIREEDDPSCQGISIASLESFLAFLRANEGLRYPHVSLTPLGNIYASWRWAPRGVFSIHFLQGDNVRFVLFRPNDKHVGKMTRVSGNTTADVVLEIARAHGMGRQIYR